MLFDGDVHHWSWACAGGGVLQWQHSKVGDMRVSSSSSASFVLRSPPYFVPCAFESLSCHPRSGSTFLHPFLPAFPAHCSSASHARTSAVFDSILSPPSRVYSPFFPFLDLFFLPSCNIQLTNASSSRHRLLLGLHFARLSKIAAGQRPRRQHDRDGVP